MSRAIEQARNPLLASALPALRQARQRAEAIAIATNTALITVMGRSCGFIRSREPALRPRQQVSSHEVSRAIGVQEQMKPSFEEAYLEEIVLQADWAAWSARQIDGYVVGQANPAAVFKEIFAFLSHVAGVSRILWPPRIHDPGKKKTAEARGHHLRTTLAIAEDHPLRNRTLRDHLEHFDERLDRWSQETTHGGIVDLHIGPVSAVVSRHPNRRVAGRHGAGGRNRAVLRARFERAGTAGNWA